MTPRGLASIGENERPFTSGPGWDTFSLPPGQMSPTFSSAQFSSTSSWFPGTRTKHRLNQKDIVSNIKAFETLVATSRQYENAIRTVSDASMQFAEALEMFAKCKDLHDDEEEEDDLVEGFRSLSGYQYYIGSQQRVLAQLVQAQCTSPLEAQLNAYRRTLISLHKSFTADLAKQTSVLKQREKQHISSSRRKNRNLDVYRKGLEDLTAQLDSLDDMKYQHFETVAQHTRQVWSSVLKRTTLAARAEVDILEKVSEKGLQNDCLGRMIASADDPFDVVPVRVIDKIAQEEPQDMYPLREWTNRRPLSTQFTTTATISSGGGGIDDYDHPHIVQTTPSPKPQHNDSFEMVDDVASIHSDEDNIPSHVSQLAIPNAPLNIPETITPPHTPPKVNENPQPNLNENNGRLLSKLGGYGWRG